MAQTDADDMAVIDAFAECWLPRPRGVILAPPSLAEPAETAARLIAELTDAAGLRGEPPSVRLVDLLPDGVLYAIWVEPALAGWLLDVRTGRLARCEDVHVVPGMRWPDDLERTACASAEPGTWRPLTARQWELPPGTWRTGEPSPRDTALTEAELWQICREGHPAQRRWLAQLPGLPQDLVLALAGDDDDAVRSAVLDRSHLPRAAQTHVLARHPEQLLELSGRWGVAPELGAEVPMFLHSDAQLADWISARPVADRRLLWAQQRQHRHTHATLSFLVDELAGHRAEWMAPAP